MGNLRNHNEVINLDCHSHCVIFQMNNLTAHYRKKVHPGLNQAAIRLLQTNINWVEGS